MGFTYALYPDLEEATPWFTPRYGPIGLVIFLFQKEDQKAWFREVGFETRLPV